MPENESYHRLISNQVRFGFGWKTIDGKKDYYAWHGAPNRNDDFITTAEITLAEFDQIDREYPNEIIAHREQAEVFRKKYIEGHRIISKAWNRIFVQ